MDSSQTADAPKDHVRRPDLPWRRAQLTECGRPTGDVGSVIDRAEFVNRVTEHGLRRMAYSTCMVCFETARSWPTWDVDPVRAMAREFLGGHQAPTLQHELTALAWLVATHRGEYDEFLEGLADTVDLWEQRRARRRMTPPPPRAAL